MAYREKLLKILNVPIYPHENIDPLEAVADYLLDNDVVPVVRCKDCKHYLYDDFDGAYVCMQLSKYVKPDFWCAHGERKDDD